jgi:hypothetical protein
MFFFLLLLNALTIKQNLLSSSYQCPSVELQGLLFLLFVKLTDHQAELAILPPH